MPLGKPLLDALDRLGYGGIVLDHSCEPIRVNDSAIRIINGDAAPASSSGDPNSRAIVVDSFLYSRGRPRFVSKEDDWTVIPHRHSSRSRPLIMRSLPIQDYGRSGARAVLILVDLSATPRPASGSLQRIFDLTPSEARLAIAMAGGETLEDIAEATDVAIGTVRKQLGSIFAKTDTHRQSELVALLARLSILP